MLFETDPGAGGTRMALATFDDFEGLINYELTVHAIGSGTGSVPVDDAWSSTGLYSQKNNSISSIPEPNTALLFGFGLVVISGISRKK